MQAGSRQLASAECWFRQVTLGLGSSSRRLWRQRFLAAFRRLSSICSYRTPKASSQGASSPCSRLEYEAIEGYLDPELQVPDPRSTLMKVAAEFPSGEPLQILTVGASTHTQSGVSVSKLAYEYVYPDAWVVVNIAIKESGGVMTVTSMHAQRREESLAQTNRLTFEGKGPAHFLFSIAAVIILGFTFWAAWLCFHTPIPRRKWLWMLFVLVSVGKLSMDWTTGTMGFAIFGIHLPAANLTRSAPFAPWVLSAGIPLGAIVFMARRGRWSKTTAAVSEGGVRSPSIQRKCCGRLRPPLIPQNVVCLRDMSRDDRDGDPADKARTFACLDNSSTCASRARQTP